MNWEREKAKMMTRLQGHIEREIKFSESKLKFDQAFLKFQTQLLSYDDNIKKTLKVYEFLLKQNIDQYAEKDKAWFESAKLDFNPPRLHSRKADLFECCRANNYLTLDEIHKAAVSLWPEKYSFTPEPAIKNEVPNHTPNVGGSAM